MSNQDNKPVNIRKHYDKDGNEIAPPTFEQRVKANKIMGYIGAALFAGFLIMTAYPYFEKMRTIQVDGTVVEVTSESSVNNNIPGKRRTTAYWHRVRFLDLEGEEHIAISIGLGRDTAYAVGAVISIGYYPDDLSKVWVPNLFGLWEIQLLLFGLGALLIWFSFYAVKKVRDEERAAG